MGNKTTLRDRAEELDIKGWADMGKKRLRKAVEAKENEAVESSHGWVVALVAFLLALGLSALGYYRRQNSA